jgi:hypothetical protein
MNWTLLPVYYNNMQVSKMKLILIIITITNVPSSLIALPSMIANLEDANFFEH